MSQITLKPNESKILTEAAAAGGHITFPDRWKEVTRQRMAGLFTQHALAEPVAEGLQLTRAGYRAVGLRPPRTAAAAASSSGEARVSTRERLLELLGRVDGASLPELMEVTGWLPHTTRAALSRLRSGGEALAKDKRQDGVTCYRLVSAEAAANIAA